MQMFSYHLAMAQAVFIRHSLFDLIAKEINQPILSVFVITDTLYVG